MCYLLLVHSITEKIRQKAFEIGFSKVGITPAAGLSDEGARLAAWLGKGFQGEMAWMARDPERRFDPRSIFPEARSMIAVALNYFTPHEHESNTAAGKISRYAWGDDYHDVVKEKLRELLDHIEAEVPDASGKICVDTAPIMDKAWAVRAGLGWQGKHSNVITKEFGSWVFLGEILLSLDLEYQDALVADHCGSCTACIDACPTDAIVEPYVVDSRKCISYATIELRTDELPKQFEGKMDGWIYGCDICQDVCPWNKFEKPSGEARFEPREDQTSLSLAEIAELTPEAYAARFRGTAIKRAKLAGLKRNAAAISPAR
ncbi:MAG: tRNA epoxyqueuosine(34) reductase QueG [Pyrinomonadaceae bacterium]